MCTLNFWPFQECAHVFSDLFRSVHTLFSVFWRVCASISWTFPESAQVFLVAAQVCTAFKPCRPEFRGPGSGFRVLLACGSSCWSAVALIPQTFSLNTGDPAQPGAPISRAGPVEARPGGAVPGQSRPGPAGPMMFAAPHG